MSPAGERSIRPLCCLLLVTALVVGAAETAVGQTPSPDPRCYDQIEPGNTLLDCPDLTFASPPSVAFSEDGTVLVVTVQVGNVGTLESDPAQALVAAEGWESSTALIPGLRPETVEPVDVLVQIPPGSEGQDVTLDVFIDPENQIPEQNENDNFTVTPVAIPSIPPPTTAASPTTEATTASVTATSGSATPANGTPPLWWVLAAAVAVVAVVAIAWIARRGGRLEAPRPPSPGEVRPVPARPARVVSTGFSSVVDPTIPLDPDRTIGVSTDVCFWLEVGEPVAGSIDARPVALPRSLLPPTGVDLEVTLSPLGRREGFDVTGDVGSISVLASGETVVREQPRQGLKPGLAPEFLHRRVLFDVRAPSIPGTYRMRCGLYRDQTLIQSRVITAEVTASPKRQAGALRAEVDYTLSARLDPAELTDFPHHTLSVMLNRSEDDTHDLMLVGRDYRIHVALDALALEYLVRTARAGLRLAAWGNDQEWQVGRRYLHTAPNLDQIRIDLVRMAQRGMALYTAIAQGLDGGRSGLERLEDDLSRPGSLQIALGRSARRILPASLVYDYRGLETQAGVEAYSLCDSFLDALDRGLALEESACFRDVCPSRGKDLVVCPSGFWGYRHEIGFPVSEEGREASPNVGFADAPAVTVAVSTDANLVERADHERVMHALWGPGAWRYADSRALALKALRESQVQVVYLYCHGGVTEIGEPFVQVGPLADLGITATVLLNENVFWEATRPLVFINGCHTTAVEPEKAFEMVSPLVALSGAAGVIGTEITVFEPLARSFAESFFPRFLAGENLGAAVRGARLELLSQLNPLGLAYIPFALPGLRLQRLGAA